MVLNELTLQNFGVYAGSQTITLTPDPQKPIVLIGGLNGRGKTTFLDAIQLVLYGKSANCSNRGNLAYDQFLGKCRNRSAKPSDTTTLELAFSHASGGKISQYRVRRFWDGERSLPKEQIRIWIDGNEDPFLAESWSDHVEGLVPSGVSQLFFFDGEKLSNWLIPKMLPRFSALELTRSSALISSTDFRPISAPLKSATPIDQETMSRRVLCVNNQSWTTSHRFMA